MAGNFVESLQGVIGLIVDGFLILANLAGGVLLAVQLQNAKCDKFLYDYTGKVKENNVFLAGCTEKFQRDDKCLRFFGTHDGVDFVEGRCKAATADTAFMFLTLVVIAVATTLLFLSRRR